MANSGPHHYANEGRGLPHLVLHKALSGARGLNAMLSEAFGVEVNHEFLHRLARYLPEDVELEDLPENVEQASWRKKLQVFRRTICESMLQVATIDSFEVGEMIIDAASDAQPSSSIRMVLEGLVFEETKAPSQGIDARLARMGGSGPASKVLHGPDAIIHEECFLLGHHQLTRLTVPDEDSWRAWVSTSPPGSRESSFTRRSSRTSNVFSPYAVTFSEHGSGSSFRKRVASGALCNDDSSFRRSMRGSSPSRASPTPKSEGFQPSPVRLASLELDKALTMIEREPLLLCKLFHALAADLTVRVSERSSTIQHATTSLSYLLEDDIEMNEPAAAVAFSRTAAEIARDFRLPRPEDEPDFLMLLVSSCTVEVECDSEVEWRASPAEVFVFSTHLCIERYRLGIFVQRKVAAFSDVLSVVADEAIGELRPVTVNLKSGSWIFELPSERHNNFCTHVEFARLSATDSSRLQTHFTGSVKAAAADTARWSTLRASLSDSQHSHTRKNPVTAARTGATECQGGLASTAQAAPVLPAAPPLPPSGTKPTSAVSNANNTVLTGSPAASFKSLHKDLWQHRVLSDDDWNEVLKCANFRKYTRGDVVITAGVPPVGLLQIVSDELGPPAHGILLDKWQIQSDTNLACRPLAVRRSPGRFASSSRTSGDRSRSFWATVKRVRCWESRPTCSTHNRR